MGRKCGVSYHLSGGNGELGVSKRIMKNYF